MKLICILQNHKLLFVRQFKDGPLVGMSEKPIGTKNCISILPSVKAMKKGSNWDTYCALVRIIWQRKFGVVCKRLPNNHFTLGNDTV